jgi:acetolactate decarboxylase
MLEVVLADGMQLPSRLQRGDMPQLECKVSQGLWENLQAATKRTGQPLAHIVNLALAEYFEAAHHTLYQISTATALVEGIYQGAVRVENLRQHGDHGLGTFENLDGEMVIVDGDFFQARCDGSVREVADDVLTPFAVITRFMPETEVVLHQCADVRRLTARFDGLRDSENMFYALRVHGLFEYIHARAVCRTCDGIPLVQAPRFNRNSNFTTSPEPS